MFHGPVPPARSVVRGHGFPEAGKEEGCCLAVSQDVDKTEGLGLEEVEHIHVVNGCDQSVAVVGRGQEVAEVWCHLEEEAEGNLMKTKKR